jgi:outer membrane protein TolC
VALGVNASEGRGADAFERALERENSVWQAGLTLTYPWGRRGEKARYRQSEVLLQRQYLALEQQEQDLLVLVREAVRRIETSAQNVVIAEQAARLSEEQYEAEQERYSSGLSTSRRVLEAQTDLERARTAHLQARLDHQVSRAALRRIEAGGLEYYGVELAQPR